MRRDQIRIMTWLRRHGVAKNSRRLIGATWTHLRNATGAVVTAAISRHRFFACLLVGIIAAVVLVHCPVAGKPLAILGLSVAALTGLVEELRSTLTR